MEKVTFDIESLVGDKLYPYQQAFWDKVSVGGFKSGEMMIISAGRRTGKSHFADMYSAVFNWAPTYEQLESAEVDGNLWTSVKCNRDTAAWVREQNTKYWYEHKGSVHAIFDLHEKLYTMLRLRFTP